MTHSKAGIPKMYLKRTMDDYRNNVDSQVMKLVEGYIAHLSEMRNEGTGILFFGPNGVGKTGLMIEVLKAISNSGAGFISTFSTMIRICDKYVESWDCNEAKEDYKIYVLESDFLAIDDIGKEFKGKTDFIVSVLDQVLRSRAIRCRPTFITSNFDAEGIRLVYGDSIASLLNDAFIPLMLVGKDFRKTTHKRRVDGLLKMIKEE